MNYSNLTNKQKSFIHHLFDMGNDDPTKTTFKRGELKTIAEQGGWAWAPAWIVKDKNRVVTRGTYNVPELAEFIAEMQEETVDIDAPVVPVHDMNAAVNADEVPTPEEFNAEFDAALDEHEEMEREMNAI